MDREQKLDDVITAYLKAVEAGAPIDQAEWLKRYPDLADELTEFFAGQQSVELVAAPLRELAQPPSSAEALTLPPSWQVGKPAGPETVAPDTDPLQAAESPIKPGDKVRYFGDYELLEEIARGGMGVVYKARQVSLNRIVALKMILAGQLASDADVKRFYSEAQTAANLQHPNIVAIHEVGEHKGQHYFSMDFVEGKSLAALTREHPLPPNEAAAIVKTVADAIHYAHAKGVLHRDLKPANVLIDAAGQPRVTDFGLAKQFHGEPGALATGGLTATGAVLGTPSYMPPEQASADRGRVGPTSDVYSLGAVLYDLVTGRPPFQGPTPVDVVLQVLSNDPVPPRQLQPKLPANLETICLKCLHKEPAKRYATAADLAEDLRRFLADEPILARPVNAWERGVKWAQRRPALAGLLAVSGVSIVGFLLAAGIFWRDAELRAETVQDLALAKGQVAEQQELVGEKRAEVQRLELVGQQERAAAEAARTTARRVHYAADMQFAHAAWDMNNVARVLTLLERHSAKGRPAGQENLCDFEWHYLHRLCHQERLTLNATSDTASVPGIGIAMASTPIAFSPDGKTLAAATLHKKSSAADYDKMIRLWDVASGKETCAFAVPDFMPTLAFAPDGQALLGSMYNPDPGAFKNFMAEAKANAQANLLVMMGKAKAKPSLQKLLQLYLVQAFTLDGRKLGEPEKLDPDRHAHLIAQDSRIVTVMINLKGQAFQGTFVVETADRKTLAVAGVSVAVDFAKPFVIPSPQNAVLFWDLTKGEPHWDLTKGEPQTVLKGMKDPVTGMAFAPDGKTLAGATGKIIKIWEVPTGKELLALHGHTALLSSVTFSRDGKTVASGSQDGMVKLWDAATGEELNTLKGHRTQVTSVAFAPDGKTLASVSVDGAIKLWDPRAAQGPTRLKLDKDIVQLVFEPDGKSLTATTDVGTRMQWDVATGPLLAGRATGKTAKFPYRLSTVSPDGKTLATLGFEQIVKLRDAVASKELRELKGHKDKEFVITHMAFSPNSQVLATASNDKSVKLWDVGTGAERCALPVWVSSLAFTPDGKTLATGTLEKTIQLWDVATGQVRSVLPKHQHPISLLRFSADGTRLGAAGGDTVKIWDLATGKEAFAIHEPGQLFRAIAVSPDGKRLATNSSRAGMTGEVKLWDTITGREVLSLPLTVIATNAMVFVQEQQLAFNPQGTRLALAERIVEVLNLGSKRSEVTIWDATPVGGKFGQVAAGPKR